MWPLPPHHNRRRPEAQPALPWRANLFRREPEACPMMSFTPHLGLFINSTVGPSSCPVGDRPPKAWALGKLTEFGFVRSSLVSCGVVKMANLKLPDVFPETVLGEEGCGLGAMARPVHVAVLHQVHLGVATYHCQLLANANANMTLFCCNPFFCRFFH